MPAITRWPSCSTPPSNASRDRLARPWPNCLNNRKRTTHRSRPGQCSGRWRRAIASVWRDGPARNNLPAMPMKTIGRSRSALSPKPPGRSKLRPRFRRHLVPCSRTAKRWPPRTKTATTLSIAPASSALATTPRKKPVVPWPSAIIPAAASVSADPRRRRDRGGQRRVIAGMVPATSAVIRESRAGSAGRSSCSESRRRPSLRDCRYCADRPRPGL